MNYVIYIQNSGISIIDNKCTNLGCQKHFSWQEEEQLKSYLLEFSPSDKVYLILDVVDEDLDLAWKPKLSIWEKWSFLKAEKNRTLRSGVSFLHAKWSGVYRTSSAGRAEELLYKVVVHSNDQVDDLVDKIKLAKLRLQGTYSVIYLLEVIFNRYLKKNFNLTTEELHKPLLFVVRLSKNRFRVIFLVEQISHFSREIAVPDEITSETEIQEKIIDELNGTVEYLYANDLVDVGFVVSLLLVDTTSHEESNWSKLVAEKYVLTVWKNPQDYFYRFTTLKSVFSALKLTSRSNDFINGDLFMSRYILTTKLPHFYQNPYQRSIMFAQNLILGLIIVNLLLLSTIFIYFTYNGISNYFKQQQIDLYKTKNIEFSRIKEKLKSKSTLTLNSTDLKDIVEFSNTLKKLNSSSYMGVDFYPISQILVNSKHITLSRIKWDIGNKIDAKYYNVTLTGLVIPFKDTFAPLVKWVDDFIIQLKQLPDTKDVTLVKEPLARNVKQALNLNGADKSVKGLPFEINLKIKR